ncbi:MAG TPA: hypothetical protein VH397_08400 [Xanthobacteraceae bacterium]
MKRLEVRATRAERRLKTIRQEIRDKLITLPATRSLIHRLPAQRLTIPYNDIAAIETRLEHYRSLGMAQMQRAYALRRRGGDLIFRFEDRALATALETSLFVASDFPLNGTTSSS